MKRRYFLIIVCFLLFNCSTKNSILKVGIQPYEDITQSLVDSVAESLKYTYGVEIIILPTRTLPQEAFIAVKSHRYRADKLIQLLSENKSDSLDYIVGLTNKDISFTKKDNQGNIKKPESKYADWGIFGLGYQPGFSCIISTFRLNHSSSKQFIERVKKVSIHEFGHNLGLEHCTSENCVMRDAVESIHTIDIVRNGLCNNCKNLLAKKDIN